MKNMRTIVWLLVGIAALAGAHVLLSLNDSRETAIVQRTSLLAVPDDAVSLISISRNGAVVAIQNFSAMRGRYLKSSVHRHRRVILRLIWTLWLWRRLMPKLMRRRFRCSPKGIFSRALSVT